MTRSIQRVIDRCSYVERVLKQLYRRTKSEWKKCKKKPIIVHFRSGRLMLL